MLQTLVYGLIKGGREICKKKALQKNSVTEVLLVYTFLSLVFCIPQFPNALGLSANQYFGVAVKSFVIFIAWIAGFKAIEKLPVSICGILDLSRVLFATLLGIVVLKESITLAKSIGLVLVSIGLLLLKFKPSLSDDGKKTWFIFLAFLSCMLNAVSGLLDKILMKEMNSSQLQVWYTLFLVVFYSIYAVFTRAKISHTAWKNIWIYLLAAGLVAMDKVLFIANGNPESQLTIMTLIKQSSVIVAIIAGKFVFHEKGILYKIFCACVIIAGIIVGIL